MGLMLKEQREDGFTLVELLVVILIIGVLTAIAVPAFMNQRKTAVDSIVRADARNLATVMHTYFTQNPNATAADLNKIREMHKKSEGVLATISGTRDDWCIWTWHPQGLHYHGDNSTWVATGQPYYVYSSTKGIGTVRGGVSGETCYTSNRFNL